MSEAPSESPDRSEMPRKLGWFHLTIGALILLFLIVVFERQRIRAMWWVHRLTETRALDERGYYLALLAGDPAASRIGWRSLEYRDEPDLRILGVYLLQRTPGDESTQALGHLLNDPIEAVRDAAGMALGFRGTDHAAMEALRTALHGARPEAASAAAAALGRVIPRLSRDELIWAISSHPAAIVRAQAAESLGSLLDTAEPGAHDSSPPASEQAPGQDRVSAGEAAPPGVGECDAIGALCRALSDRGEFHGSLALEREIEAVSAFAATKGRAVDLAAAPEPSSRRTVAQVAADSLARLTGLDIRPVGEPDAVELTTLMRRCRTALAARRASAAAWPTSQPRGADH